MPVRNAAIDRFFEDRLRISRPVTCWFDHNPLDRKEYLLHVVRRV